MGYWSQWINVQVFGNLSEFLGDIPDSFKEVPVELSPLAQKEDLILNLVLSLTSSFSQSPGSFTSASWDNLPDIQVASKSFLDSALSNEVDAENSCLG